MARAERKSALFDLRTRYALQRESQLSHPLISIGTIRWNRDTLLQVRRALRGSDEFRVEHIQHITVLFPFLLPVLLFSTSCVPYVLSFIKKETDSTDSSAPR